MERDFKVSPKITILYRMAEKKNKTSKVKPDWINNENCLRNLAKYTMHANLIVFGDNLNESLGVAKEYANEFIKTKNHGNANTFLEVLDYALTLPDDNIVYFVEDDFIHRPDFEKIILEGLEIADYVTLYNHPDKFIYEFNCTLFLTKSTHWRTVKSTTMTFASRVKTLKFDCVIFEKMCQGQQIPPDYYIWHHLTGNLHRRLISPIPGECTHGEINFLGPVIDWKQYL